MKTMKLLGPVVLRGAPLALSALAAGVVVPSACSDSREASYASLGEGANPSDAPTAPNAASPDAAEGPDAGEAASHAAPIAFSPCEDDPSLQCGTLRVPVDHKRPNGEGLDLAVIRAPAASPKDRLGTIVLNPGGPGGSGVNFLLALVSLYEPLRERFDLVSFDPRGVGLSRKVGCTVDAPPVPAPGDVAAENAFFDEIGKRTFKACLDQNGPLVTHMSTNDVARDIDLLRASLGESKINYLGYSYGTELGAVYASLFPKRVRAMVLDGNVMPEFDDYMTERFVEQFSGHAATFQRLAQVCGADPGCPLFGQSLVAAFDEITAKLDAQPFTSPDGVVLTGKEVRRITTLFLMTDNTDWPLIVRGVAAARNGDLAKLFEIYGPLVRPPPPASPVTLFSGTPFLCSDYGTRAKAADIRPFIQAAAGNEPRFFDATSALTIVTRCASWPAADVPVIRDVSGLVKNPIVLISNDWDNVTPLASGRRLAHALGMDAHLVRYQGGGHQIYAFGSECIDAAVNGYFIDLVPPSKGLACPALPLDFSAPAAPTSEARAAEADRAAPSPRRAAEVKRALARPEGY
jgi:pimeloyl-ACP methyl ester carboxylesterase